MLQQKGKNPYNIGDPVLVPGRQQSWIRGVVKEIDYDRVFIHYIGWPHFFDEWISHDAEHLKPAHVKDKALQVC